MNLQLFILQSLDAAGDYLIPLETVIAEVRLRGSQASRTEILAAIDSLESKRQLSRLTSEDAPGGSRLKIADGGRVRLSEAIL